GNTGSKYIVSEGVLQEADAAFALHMCPWLEVGNAQVNAGYSMANNDIFKGTIIGRGGHGAYPQQSKDPIWMTSYVIEELYSIVSKQNSTLIAGVVSNRKLYIIASTNITTDKT